MNKSFYLLALLACWLTQITDPILARASCGGDTMRVEIVGNKKTRPEVIRRIAGLKSECTPEKGVDSAAVKQKLLNSHLFSSVDVEIEKEPGITKVHITVKERWTIIPVPIFYTQKEDTGGGFLIMEANLLGRKKVIAAGGTVSTHGERYEAFYFDDAVWGSRWVLITRGFRSNVNLTRYEDDKEVYVYHQEYNQIFGIAGWKVTDALLPGMGLMWRYRTTGEVRPYSEPPHEGLSNSVIINLRYDKTNYTSFYDQGFSALVVAEQTAGFLGSERDYGHLVGTFDLTEPLWKILTRTDLEAGKGWGPDQNILTYFKLGGKVGSRGLPARSLWISDFVSISEQIEERLFTLKLGTFTATQFVDATFTSEDDPVRVYTAPGVGLRAYLKELAVPAFGVDVAYSLRTNQWRLSAFIGKSF